MYWSLILYELIAISCIILIKLIVDFFRKRYYLNKAFSLITKRLDGGVTDVMASISGTYSELPIKISLVSFLSKYVDYLTENSKKQYVASVNECRRKANEYSRVSNVPYDMIHLMERAENAAKEGNAKGVTDWLNALMISISEKERLYSINKKLNTISVILGIIGVIGVVATLYFGFKSIL